jgi:phosphatidylglycerophosphatase A
VERFVASGFGVGLLARRVWGSDSGAGTLGAAVGAAVSLALYRRSVVWHVLAALVATALSLWSARRFAAGGDDPGWVVIDEVAGTLVGVIGLTGWPWVAGLVIARLGDITKDLPGVAAAERLPGALGITADDVVAGLYGLAAGWALAVLI